MSFNIFENLAIFFISLSTFDEVFACYLLMAWYVIKTKRQDIHSIYGLKLDILIHIAYV